MKRPQNGVLGFVFLTLCSGSSETNCHHIGCTRPK
ncbi:hypothetical protein RJ641_018493 [Dillenia turbinata]|uniref:Uncharacterized protein n=1 Tax=Dillenia turbinata TaxID=194707 RepID=A0AAN8UYH7_9MAGN